MPKFSITDIQEFILMMRSFAATSLAEEYLGEPREYEDEELESLITLNQVESIVEENSIERTKDDKYIINEDIFDNIFDDVRNQLYQSTMSQLASKGYIECAWDDKEDKMIFWVDKAKK